MAERAGAAVDVDLLVGKVEVAHRGHRDDREGLVDLVEIDAVRLQPVFSNSLRIAPTGAVGNFEGSAAYVAWPTMRASGVRPRLSASLSRISTSAAAPSEIEQELAAVTVPPSRKAGRSVGIFSGRAFGGCSSAATRSRPCRS